MPIRAHCKWLIYMGREGLGRTVLPVCGQRRAAGAHGQRPANIAMPEALRREMPKPVTPVVVNLYL